MIINLLSTVSYFTYILTTKKTNRTRVAQLNNNIKPYLHIKLNNNNNIYKFEKDNKHIDLLLSRKIANQRFYQEIMHLLK